MQNETLVPCARKACRCIVEVDDEYCSAECRETSDKPLQMCPCGHPECIGSEEAVEGDEEVSSADE
jgi:hypothetical protein